MELDSPDLQNNTDLCRQSSRDTDSIPHHINYIASFAAIPLYYNRQPALLFYHYNFILILSTVTHYIPAFLRKQHLQQSCRPVFLQVWYPCWKDRTYQVREIN